MPCCICWGVCTLFQRRMRATDAPRWNPYGIRRTYATWRLLKLIHLRHLWGRRAEAWHHGMCCLFFRAMNEPCTQALHPSRLLFANYHTFKPKRPTAIHYPSTSERERERERERRERERERERASEIQILFPLILIFSRGSCSSQESKSSDQHEHGFVPAAPSSCAGGVCET